ncbi:MAG: 50S ribosomal protein L4 [Gammaproteobacteria bacterium]|nr:50S ribosomal protein L4 [Gammaproteobacteria bacterium]|tara:strand:- start:14146 stop:14772 length:627 start_codon:yes stop_codon:yes gene_type:complete
MKIQVLNQTGGKDSEIEYSDSLLPKFYNDDLVHQFLSTYIDNSHQGTKGQKNRSAVRGGGRKPWRQKGTGRARAGTIRSPIWRSGGVTFAKVYKPKKKKKINKKMYRSALRSILLKLINEERLLVITSIEINEPPTTSQVRNILLNLNLSNAVFVLAEKDKKFELASKNLFNTKVQTVHSLNPVEIINSEKVVITASALNLLQEVLLK